MPAAIEVITGDTIRDMGATNLRDALVLAAGVDIAPGGDGGPATSVPAFWGLQEFDAFLLVVDGVPWGGAYAPALTSLSMRDVNRVEILRGAAPVTFGATSFVGVIHVVHKPAEQQSSYASVDVGSQTSGSVALDLALGHLGTWTSRLNAVFDRQGFADPRTSYTRGQASWRAAKVESDRRMWVGADLSLLRQDPGSPHPLDDEGQLAPDVPLDANHNPAGAFLNENRIAATFGLDRPMGASRRLGLIASVTRTSGDQFRGFLGDMHAQAEDNAHGLREETAQTDLYVDGHVSGMARPAIRWTAGGDYLHGNAGATGATFDYAVPLSGNPVPSVDQPGVLDLRVEDRREFFGAYGLFEVDALPRVTLSGGLRLNVTFEEGGDAERVSKAEQDTGTTHVRPSGSVGAMVRLWARNRDHLRAFFDYRNTFKPAVFDFGLGEGEAESGDERGALQPETAQSWETGLKARTLSGLLDVEVSAFSMTFDNLVTATMINGLPALQNTGRTRFRGIELATSAQLPHAVTARATYSYHDGRFVRFDDTVDGEPVAVDGNRVQMSPHQLVSAGIVVAPDEGFVADAIVKYVGQRFLDARNLASTEGFTAIDLGAAYRHDRWEVRVDGRNLLDRRQPVSVSELGEGQYYRMVAREVKAGFSVRF